MPSINWRIQTVTMALFGLWCVVGVRLLFIQLWKHEDFSTRALAQQRYIETIPARVGDLLDRHGRLLATTLKTHSLYVDPSRLEAPEKLAAQLAPVLDLDALELTADLERHRDRRFHWIKRRLTEQETQAVVALELPRDLCGLREEYRRRYPHHHLAAHVLGWRDVDGIGQAGVERSLNHLLQGTAGQRTLVRDARGYVLDILEEVTQPPVHGQPLRLTLDLELQAVAERELDRLMADWQSRSASIIAMDPGTGEVLAMASRPTFDPNAPASSGVDAWINRAVSAADEPGSTLKPLIVGWALHSGRIDRDEIFDCGAGEYPMGRRTLHDTHPHGKLDVSGILVRSSNIGMAQIGERLGNDELFAALQAFGFGRRTGIELPGESTGIVRPREAWDDYSTGSVPMGQEVAATPLQILTAHAVLANAGLRMTPHLVLGQRTPQSAPGAVFITRVIEASVANWLVRHPLVEVVTTGTAWRAQLEGIEVFAKTGTAQVFDSEAGAYASERFVSSCVCGGPARAPQAVVLVTVQDATSDAEPYGGLVAAPVAATVLREALSLSEDRGRQASRAEQPSTMPR